MNAPSTPENRLETLLDDRGVSAVIGVILMVAVATILGSIVGAYAFGLLDGVLESPAPQASFDTTYSASADTLTIEHEAGERLVADEISVRGGGAGSQSWSAAGGTASEGRISSGDRVTIPITDADEPVTLVWDDGRRSAVLLRWDGATGAATPAVSASTGGGFVESSTTLSQSNTNRARIREGRGNWELGLGANSPPDAVTGDYTWVSGETATFALTYDPGAGTYELTVDRPGRAAESITWAGSAPADSGRLAVQLKAEPGDTVSLSNLQVTSDSKGTRAVSPARIDAPNGSNKRYLLIEDTGDLSNGFIISGEFTFELSSPQEEIPSIDILVET